MIIFLSPWNELYDPMREWKGLIEEPPFLDTTNDDGGTIVNHLKDLGHDITILDRRPPISPDGPQPDLFIGVGAGNPIESTFSVSGRLKFGSETIFPLAWIGPTVLTSYPSYAYYRSLVRGLKGDIEELNPCSPVPPHFHDVQERADCVRENVDAVLNWFENLQIPRQPIIQASQNNEPKSGQIFFCYNSRDSEQVNAAYKALKDMGLNCFIDSEDLKPGTVHQPAIQDSLKQSSTILVFLGQTGLGPWQGEEIMEAISMAISEKKTVIPVLLRGSNPKELPFGLGSRTWIDLRDGNISPLVELF